LQPPTARDAHDFKAQGSLKHTYATSNRAIWIAGVELPMLIEIFGLRLLS